MWNQYILQKKRKKDYATLKPPELAQTNFNQFF